MKTLSSKIDFAIIIGVQGANPNGDPLNGNRPRVSFDNFGKISDVCLKRKIRDRMVERYMTLAASEKPAQAVLVQADDRKCDDVKSLSARVDAALTDISDADTFKRDACATWLDVRSFGALLAFKSKKPPKKSAGTEDSDAESKGKTSIGIRGPVTIQDAISVGFVDIEGTQITKSVNTEDSEKKGSDTMGMKYTVNRGIYVAYGSMNRQCASITNFTDADAEVIKSILPRMFENDASAARPEGSMWVVKVIWWDHKGEAKYSAKKVHESLTVRPDGSYDLQELEGLTPEEIPGF